MFAVSPVFRHKSAVSVATVLLCHAAVKKAFKWSMLSRSDIEAVLWHALSHRWQGTGRPAEKCRDKTVWTGNEFVKALQPF